MSKVTQDDALDDSISTSFSMPGDMWLEVRSLANRRRVSAQSLWLVAMREFLDRQEDRAA